MNGLASAVVTSPALLLEYLLLMTAFKITLTVSVATVLRWYLVQSLILAAVVGFTAWEKIAVRQGSDLDAMHVGILLAIMALPLLLGLAARPLLARATRVTQGQGSEGEAERVWRDMSEQSVSVRPWDGIAFVALIALAALVAVRFHLARPADTISLTVALTLHLVGLFMMVLKRDLISQTVGLLVMDQGLYLAVLKVVDVPVPALFFVVGLWFYTIITVVILVHLVPQVRRQCKADIDLDEIAEQTVLKG